MAKNSIRDYSATNSSNTDIQSIDISEGCSPAGINNAIREVMADLKDVSTGAVALESPAFDSASLTGDLTFGDNDKAIFGAGSDLQIYHDGSNSYIYDGGAGNLIIKATDIRIRTATDENYITATQDGALSLYYDNETKLATTATGVDITGTVTADKLNLSSTTNIGGSAGTMSNAALRIGTTAASSMYFDTNEIHSAETLNFFSNGTDNSVADYIRFSTGGSAGSERMRIDSSGNVGIGVVPSAWRSSTDAIQFGQSASISSNNNANAVSFTSNSYINSSNNSIYISTGKATNYYQYDGAHVWEYAGSGSAGATVSYSEAARIDSSGNLLLQKTSATNSGAGTYFQVPTTPTTMPVYLHFCKTHSGVRDAIDFNHNGSRVGSVQFDNTSTSYNTSSDYRLKTAVNYDWDATTRLKQLRPARFEWIADGDDAVPVDGFLAHEVQDVVPEAITGTKDGMRDEEYEVSAATGDIYTPATDDADEVIHSTDVERPEELAEGQQWRETTAAVMGTRSVPDYQGIDQSKLVPLLVKTIQELEARITALEAN